MRNPIWYIWESALRTINCYGNVSYGYSPRSQSHLERGPRNSSQSLNVQFQEEQTSRHTLETASPGQIAILNQNPHLKHGNVFKCHFEIQLPFYSFVFFYLKTGTVWSLQCVAFGENFLELSMSRKGRPSFISGNLMSHSKWLVCATLTLACLSCITDAYSCTVIPSPGRL